MEDSNTPVDTDSVPKIFSKWVNACPNHSAIAFELSKTYPQGASILCPSIEIAENIAEELRFFCKDDPNINIHTLRALDIDAHLQRRPAISERKDRLRFFSQIKNPSKDYFFWTIPALLEKHRPEFFLKTHTLVLKKGLSIKREALIQTLLKLGYEESELVEVPGQFASRGSLVDFYSFHDDVPCRTDLSEDFVQSIHTFNPQDQMREGTLKEIKIWPAREFLADPKVFKSQLKNYLLKNDYPVEIRESLLAQLENPNCIPLGFELWSFLDDQQTQDSTSKNSLDTLFLSELRPTILIEPDSLSSAIRNEHAHLSRKLSLAYEVGDCPPKVDDFLLQGLDLSSELRKRLKKASAYSLNTVLQTLPEEIQVESSECVSAKLIDLSADWKAHNMAAFAKKIITQAETQKIYFAFESLSQKERLEFLLSPYGLLFGEESHKKDLLKQTTGFFWTTASLAKSFISSKENTLYLSERDLLGTAKNKKKKASKSIKDVFFRDIREGDLVVHQTHGIGQYLGLKTLSIQGHKADLIEISYKDGKVFVPVQQLRMLSRYSSAENSDAQIDKLGGTTWGTKKEKAKKEILALAGELLNLYSQRSLAKGIVIDPPVEKVHEFAASFPFDETPDQEKAIASILEDLKSGHPMDRLLCGDVGYGKTEVSLRAAHSVVAAGYQVAVLSPTTLLTAQHEKLFKTRLGEFGFKVASLSRFCSDAEAREILKKVAAGEVNVVVGTHRLLSNDVQFKNLGLLVVDEEQRFGVIHKERLKKMRTNVHVLSMTATPIPRSLSMALSGIRDFSVMTTPPQDRLSIKTNVVRKNYDIIKEAIEFEIKRGGQCFYLFNRVKGIEKIFDDIKKLLPDLRVEFAHGQMNETQLEERMLKFYRGETQVLITTTIIEAGLDVSNANTLIVENADNFGLSQLYQIRGRVGRSDRKAYAYLLLPERGAISKVAEQRLGILETYQDLGSGFTIASHDLDLRGSGEYLGDSQSGHMSLVGSETYFELLQESLADLKGEALERDFEPEIQLNLDSTIPETYIKETSLRLSFYRRFSSAGDEENVDLLLQEMEDRFGLAPQSVKTYSRVMKILCALRRLRIRSLSSGKNGVTIIFDTSSPVSRERLVDRVIKYPKHFQISPDGKFVVKRVTGSDAQDDMHLLQQVDSALSQLAH